MHASSAALAEAFPRSRHALEGRPFKTDLFNRFVGHTSGFKGRRQLGATGAKPRSPLEGAGPLHSARLASPSLDATTPSSSLVTSVVGSAPRHPHVRVPLSILLGAPDASSAVATHRTQQMQQSPLSHAISGARTADLLSDKVRPPRNRHVTPTRRASSPPPTLPLPRLRLRPRR